MRTTIFINVCRGVVLAGRPLVVLPPKKWGGQAEVDVNYWSDRTNRVPRNLNAVNLEGEALTFYFIGGMILEYSAIYGALPMRRDILKLLKCAYVK